MTGVALGYDQEDHSKTRLATKEVITIQYSRGAAAIMVVLHHLSTSTARVQLFIPQWGEFGVAIFFVISGFIIWHTTVTASEMSPVDFYRRRVIRVVPLYWLFLCAVVIVALLAPESLKSTVITPADTIKSFLFVPQFHLVQKGLIAPILIPGWSLNYEMFFYCIFGLSLLLRSPPNRALLVGAILFTLVVIGAFFKPHGAIASTYTNPKLFAFLCGIALAILYRSTYVISRPFLFVLLPIGLVMYLLPTSNFLHEIGEFTGLTPTLIVAGALSLELIVRRAPSQLCHIIGNASYSIYLSHLFFLRAAEIAWRHFVSFGSSRLDDAVYVVLAFSFALAGGIAVYYAVERPILIVLQKAFPAMMSRMTGTGLHLRLR